MYKHWLVGTLAAVIESCLLILKEASPDWISSHIDPKILMPILLTVISATLLSIIIHLVDLKAQSVRGTFSDKSIGDAILGISRRRKLKTLDIYAISSRHIHAQLVNNRILAKQVRVMLWNPDRTLHGQSVFESFGAEISQVIRSGWGSNGSKSCFDRVTIKRYNDIPDIFYLIINSKKVIIGIYSRNSDPNSMVDFENTFLFDSKDSITTKMRDDIMCHFDSIWNSVADEIIIGQR